MVTVVVCNNNKKWKALVADMTMFVPAYLYRAFLFLLLKFLVLRLRTSLCAFFCSHLLGLFQSFLSNQLSLFDYTFFEFHLFVTSYINCLGIPPLSRCIFLHATLACLLSFCSSLSFRYNFDGPEVKRNFSVLYLHVVFT